MSTTPKKTQTPKKTPHKTEDLKSPSKTPSKALAPPSTPHKTPKKEDEDSVVLDSVPITPKKTPLKSEQVASTPSAKQPTPKSASKIRTPISTPKKVPFADSSDSESDSSSDEEDKATTTTTEKILKKTSPSVGSVSGKRTPISAPKSIPFEDSSDSDSDDEDDHHDEPIAVRTEKLGTPPRKEVVSNVVVDVAAEPIAKVATPKKASTPAKPSNLSLPTNMDTSSDDEDVPAKVKRTPISTPKKVPYADSSDSDSDEDDDEDVKMTEAAATTKPITPKKASPASVAGKRTPISAPKSVPFEDSSDSDSDDEDDHHDEPIAVRTEKLGTPPRKEISVPFELDEEEKLEDEEHDLEVMKLSELEEKKRKHDKVEDSTTDSTEPENKKKKYQHAQKVGISENFLLESLQKTYPSVKFAAVQAKGVYFHAFFETQRERSDFGNIIGKEKDNFYPFNEERRKAKEARQKAKKEKKAAAAASTEGESTNGDKPKTEKPKNDKPKKNNNKKNEKRKEIKAKKNNSNKKNDFKKNDKPVVKQEKPVVEVKKEIKQEVKEESKPAAATTTTTTAKPTGLKIKKASDALKK